MNLVPALSFPAGSPGPRGLNDQEEVLQGDGLLGEQRIIHEDAPRRINREHLLESELLPGANRESSCRTLHANLSSRTLARTRDPLPTIPAPGPDSHTTSHRPMPQAAHLDPQEPILIIDGGRVAAFLSDRVSGHTRCARTPCTGEGRLKSARHTTRIAPSPSSISRMVCASARCGKRKPQDSQTRSPDDERGRRRLAVIQYLLPRLVARSHVLLYPGKQCSEVTNDRSSGSLHRAGLWAYQQDQASGSHERQNQDDHPHHKTPGNDPLSRPFLLARSSFCQRLRSA